MARPMPRDGPVTTATRPCSRFPVVGAPSSSNSFSLSIWSLHRRDHLHGRRTAEARRHGAGSEPTGGEAPCTCSSPRVRTAVIVATYEQPRWLDLALRAWARQELPASRVIVADDGSGPETAEVVRKWGAEHLRPQRGGDRFGKGS